MLLIFVGSAGAQLMPMEVVEREDYPFLQTFVVPAAADMAVCDRLKLLTVLHEPEHDADVSVFRLDGKGVPGDAPVATLKLPRPDALKDRNHYALSAVFHPKLPLLYIWQDIEGPRKKDPADEKRDKAFGVLKHLLIYRFEGDKATLIQSLASGDDFAYGRMVGYIALNEQATRLYVPNLLIAGSKGKRARSVGYFELGAQGTVLLDETKRPLLISSNGGPFGHDHAAGGFVPVSDEVVIVCAGYGPISWNLVDKRQQFGLCYLWPPRYRKRIAGHPTLPVVYICCLNEAYIQCVEHADGYPTMLPQVASANGPSSRPVVMAKHNLVAFGGRTALQFFLIDEEGRFSGKVHNVPARRDYVRAVVYSEQFDKLYVAEDPKE